MPSVSFSGLASGVQWGNLLDQLKAAETARRVSPIEAQANLQRQRVEALGRFRTLVSNLSTASQAFRDGTPLDAVRVSTSAGSGPAPVSVTAGPGAVPGTRSIQVVQLASTESWASAVFTAGDEPLAVAGVDLTINGVDIDFDPEDGLNGLRDRINAAAAGVTASVVRVADGEYRLAIMSNNSGAAGIAIAGDLADDLGLARTRAGSDAIVDIDGVQVRRPTNSISDALDGLALTLNSTGAAVQVQVSRDHDALLAAARELATAYNAVRSFVDDQNTGTGRPLTRDPVLRQAVDSFKNVLFADAAGAGEDGFARLALVGITLDRQGRLQVDDKAIRAAATDSPGALRALLADAGGRMMTAAQDVVRAETGSIAGRTRSMTETIMRLNRQADDARTRVDRMLDRMTKDFLRMEDALGRINAQGNWLAGQIDSLYRPTRK